MAQVRITHLDGTEDIINTSGATEEISVQQGDKIEVLNAVLSAAVVEGNNYVITVVDPDGGAVQITFLDLFLLFAEGAPETTPGGADPVPTVLIVGDTQVASLAEALGLISTAASGGEAIAGIATAAPGAIGGGERSGGSREAPTQAEFDDLGTDEAPKGPLLQDFPSDEFPVDDPDIPDEDEPVNEPPTAYTFAVDAEFSDGEGGGPENATDGSAIKTTLNVTAGDQITFDFNFLDAESTGQEFFNDFAFVVVGDDVIKLADIFSPIADFDVSTSIGTFDVTGPNEVTVTFTQSGDVMFGFGVMNEGDAVVDPALLIDNLTGALVESFEAGFGGDWTILGSASVVDDTFGIPPTDGDQQALLDAGGNATDAAIEAFFGLPAGTLDSVASDGAGGPGGEGFFAEFDLGGSNDGISIGGSDPEDGLTTSYTITSLPSDGLLFWAPNGDGNFDTLLSVGDVLTADGDDIADNVLYVAQSIPEDGQDEFTYTTTDSEGLVSAPATVTIDFPGTTVSVDDADVSDGNAFEDPSLPGSDSLIFTVSLADSVGGDVKVFFTLGGAATAGVDYDTSGLTSEGGGVFSVVISGGSTSATFELPVLDDADVEEVSPESVNVTLTGTDNTLVTIGDGSGTGMITDLNGTITIADSTVTEGDDLSFAVTMNITSGSLDGSEVVVVPLVWTDNETDAGDYGTLPTSVTLTEDSPGVWTGTIILSTESDALAEGAETLTVEALDSTVTVDGVPAEGITGHDALGTINDGTTLNFKLVGSTSVNEDDAGTYTLSLENGTLFGANTASVSINFSLGTTEVEDFDPAVLNDLLDAAALELSGETGVTAVRNGSSIDVTVDSTFDGSVDFTIDTAADDLAEGTETFNQALSGATGSGGFTVGLDAANSVDTDIIDASSLNFKLVGSTSVNEDDAGTYTLSLENGTLFNANTASVSIDFSLGTTEVEDFDPAVLNDLLDAAALELSGETGVTAVRNGSSIDVTVDSTFDGSVDFTIDTAADDLVEGTETFNQALSGATGSGGFTVGLDAQNSVDTDIVDQTVPDVPDEVSTVVEDELAGGSQNDPASVPGTDPLNTSATDSLILSSGTITNFVYNGGLGDADALIDGGSIFTINASDGSWTMVINKTTGVYTFELLAALDHADPTMTFGDDTLSGAFTSTVTFPGGTDPAVITITVNDDGPSAFTPERGYVSNFVEGPPTETATHDLNFAVAAGADGPDSVLFDLSGLPTDATGTLATDVNGLLLSVNGDQIYLVGDGTDTLIGATDPNNAEATKAFVITLDESTDSYTIDVFQPISNGTEITDIDFVGAKAGNNDIVGVGSNDATNKLDFLLSGSDSVNTNNTSLGVGSGQRIDNTETARFDFVTELTDDGASPTVTFSYVDIFPVTTFKQTIAVVNPSGTGTATFSVLALITDGDLDLFGDPTGESQIDVIDAKVFNELGVEITSPTYVTITGGVATFTNIEEGWEYEIITADGFSAVEVTGGDASAFKLGIFTVRTESEDQVIDFATPIDGVDGDGDSIDSEITATFLPDGSILGTDGGETLNGTSENDIIAGFGGDDVLNGLAGNDQLFGGAGDDTLDGGAGDDEITGDSGDDELTGGAGLDSFIYNGASDIAGSIDTILDFTETGGGDVDTFDFSGLTGDIGDVTFDNGGTGGDVRVLFDGDTVAELDGTSAFTGAVTGGSTIDAVEVTLTLI